MEEECRSMSKKETMTSILRDNTQKIYNISGRITKILSLLTGNNAVAGENNEPKCVMADLKNQQKELIDISNQLEEIEKILN